MNGPRFRRVQAVEPLQCGDRVSLLLSKPGVLGRVGEHIGVAMTGYVSNCGFEEGAPAVSGRLCHRSHALQNLRAHSQGVREASNRRFAWSNMIVAEEP